MTRSVELFFDNDDYPNNDDGDVHSDLMGEDGEEPVDEPDARDGCKKHEPEIEKHVDLKRREIEKHIDLKRRNRKTLKIRNETVH